MLYKIAGLTVELKNKYFYTERLCRDYETDNTQKVDIVLQASAEEIEAELSDSSVTNVGYCEGVCLYRKLCALLPSYDAVMFHSAAVEVKGEGFAFFGKSGSGKSTHAALWKRIFGDGLIFVNGDKPIYRFEDGILYAYGTPWCGKEGLNTNTKTAIKALGLIKKASENSVRALSPKEAATSLIEQVIFPKDAVGTLKTMDFLDRMISTVPIYEISCSISEEAAKLAYETMKGR